MTCAWTSASRQGKERSVQEAPVGQLAEALPRLGASRVVSRGELEAD
jgi:hypothetical protein